jgi:hypothetical protein
MRPLREALEAAIRYLPLHNEAMTPRSSMGDLVILKSEIVGVAGSHGRQAIELAVGVTPFSSPLCGDTWRSRPVWFSHAGPMNMVIYLRIFVP